MDLIISLFYYKIMKNKAFFAIILLLALKQSLFSQESLKSIEEDYYDFLSLEGTAVRPCINYRTLSSNEWTLNPDVEDFDEKILWKDKNLGTKFILLDNNDKQTNIVAKTFDRSIKVRVYGPELFTSWNSKVPFGQNDGVLWQGRGFNTSISAGTRIEAYGFSATIRPQYAYSQNKYFAIMPSSISNEYGYYWGTCDAPQRFGSSAFTDFDWGDTDIRWSWKNFTVGFGTQAIWLGPAFLNPILLSNNAPTFPKFDIGLTKTSLYVPHFKWYVGDIETRLVIGKTTESDYFDDDSSNDHNQFNLFSFAYSPSFLPGLTIALNKICINKWGDKFWQYAYPGFSGNTIASGEEGEDGKASITADWLFTKVGFDIYAELGVDDFLSKGLKFYEYARYPWHTVTYTVGFKKSLDITQKFGGLKGLLQFEWNNTEQSQDYQMWPNSTASFGFHHQITQGFTNRGQWLGSGIGYGGNSQYLSFSILSRHGYEKLIIGRNNIDSNYIWSKCNSDAAGTTTYMAYRYFVAFKANFYCGFENLYFVTKNLSVKFQFLYDMLINPHYDPGDSGGGVYRDYNYLNNYHTELTLKYNF